MNYLLIASLVSAAAAQSCMPNIMMDNMRQHQQAFIDGMTRSVNLLTGDYGGVNVSMDFSHMADKDGYLSITPTDDNNFFFFKANAAACVDLTPFTGINMIVSAPVGATSQFTFTVKLPDCINRDDAGDSTYVNVQGYHPFNGNKQQFLLPNVDFTSKASGNGTFDFKHFKDYTFVNMKPKGAEFKFYWFEMVGNCPNASQNAMTVDLYNSLTSTPSGASVLIPSNPGTTVISGSLNGTGNNGYFAPQTTATNNQAAAASSAVGSTRSAIALFSALVLSLLVL